MSKAQVRRLINQRLHLTVAVETLRDVDPAEGDYTETIKGIEERIAQLTVKIDDEDRKKDR